MIMNGVLVRTLLNQGSKSEHYGFILKTQMATYVPAIHVEQEIIVQSFGDNPFEHNDLKPFDNCDVEIDGEIFNGKLIAKTIRLINE